MKEFIVFSVLPILVIGCAVTSTKQSQESGVRRQESTPLLSPPSQGGDRGGVGLKTQDSELKTGLKLAEPDPETLLRPRVRSQGSGIGRQESEQDTYKRKPWGGIWSAPLYQSPPIVGQGAASQNIETPPAARKDYTEVDFGKFTSGSYGSEYANKYVKIRCRFLGIATELGELPKYRRPEYTTFFVTGVNSQLHTLRIVVPRSLTDAAYKLEPQEEIILYGKAVRVDLHTLTLEVYKIER